jgi:hypothetical protein
MMEEAGIEDRVDRRQHRNVECQNPNDKQMSKVKIQISKEEFRV